MESPGCFPSHFNLAGHNLILKNVFLNKISLTYNVILVSAVQQ